MLCWQGGRDAVFTRPNGIAVRSFRDAWEKACVGAGVGQILCDTCGVPMPGDLACGKCKSKRTKYIGLILHDLRRTAARNLRLAGISETVIMKIGGWRTRSVFERYAIVRRGDIVEAMQKLQTNQRESLPGHEIGHAAETEQTDSTVTIIN